MLHPCLEAADRLCVDRDFLAACFHSRCHAAGGKGFHLLSETLVFVSTLVQPETAQELSRTFSNLNFRALSTNCFCADVQQDEARFCAIGQWNRNKLSASVKFSSLNFNNSCSAASLKTTFICPGPW